MSFLTPGVTIVETDISDSYSANSASVAFYSGDFEKGLMNVPTLVSNAKQFKNLFGVPKNLNDWYTVYNYLQYAGNIYVNRIKPEDSGNALVYLGTSYSPRLNIQSLDEFNETNGNLALPPRCPVAFFARTPGEWGNKLSVMMITYEQVEENVVLFGNTRAKSVIKYMKDKELAVVILRNDIIVETFVKSPEKFNDINVESNYIYVKIMDALTNSGLSGSTDGNLFYIDSNIGLYDGLISYLNAIRPAFYGNDMIRLSNGYTGEVTPDLVGSSYELLESKEEYIIDVVIGNEMNNYGAYNLVEKRKDCIAIIGTPNFQTDVVNKTIEYSYLYPSQYVVLVSNYKKQRDGFTNKEILVNLAGDVAGIRVKTDNEHGFYIAAAGYQRGTLREAELVHRFSTFENAAFLSNNINYFNNINGIIYLESQNTNFEGNSFSNVNIRHTFNKIERESELQFRQFVFEENNDFTRNRISSFLKSYLDTIKYSNGIEDYKVICDRTNNTTVSSGNDLVVDIMIKPKFAVQYIQIRVTNAGVTEI